MFLNILHRSDFCHPHLALRTSRVVPGWLGCILLGLSVLACEQQDSLTESETKTEILAQVGDETISASDFEDFVADLPTWTASDKKGSAQVRDYLQTLIDRILILRQARAQGLQESSEVRQNLDRILKKYLGKEAASRQIRPQVVIGAEELERAFVERHWNRRLKVAHILVSTRADLDEVAAALAAGRPFGEVARQFSQHPPSAARGGQLPHYHSPGGATQAVRDALFHLQVGEITAAVANRKGYEIFKVLDEQQVAYEEVAERIHKELVREQLSAVRRTYIDSLAQHFGLEPHPAGLATLMGILRRVEAEGVGRLSPAAAQTPLFSYSGGVIALEEAVRQSSFIRRGKGVDDSLKVMNFLESDVVVPQLLLLWAYELGIDRDPQIQTWTQSRKEELLIREMRRLEATEKAVVDEAEVSQFYAENKENYRTPSQVEVVEIMVGTQGEAQELLERIQADRRRAAPLIALLRRLKEKLARAQATGAELQALRQLGDEPPVFAWLRQRLEDEEKMVQFLEEVAAASPEDLAEQYIVQQLVLGHSLRSGSVEAEGHYHLHWYDEAQFGPLVEAAMEAEMGTLIGPVQNEEFYSIGKVVQRQESTPRPFAEVEERIIRRLRRDKENVLFGHFLKKLRTTYRDEVKLFDANIETLGRKLSAAAGD